MGYREHQPSIAPPWMQGTNGRKWHEQFGAAKDGVGTRARAAVLNELAGECDVSALPFLGVERMLEQGASETDATFRVRLRTAWSEWQAAGGPLALLDQLAAIGYTSANGDPVIVQANGRAYQRSAGGALVTTDLGPNWRISGSPPWWWVDPDFANWPRFAVLFPGSGSLPSGWATPTSPPSVDPGQDEVDQIVRLIRRWKPAKARCVGILVVTAGGCWGWPVTDLWGDVGDVWGGDTVITWTV